MGGGVSLESELGKGSVFTVTFSLPVSSIPEPAQAQSMFAVADKSTKPFAGVRVLIAEDNPVNLKLLKILLENLGCEVDSALNGVKALEKARMGKYHAAIIDMKMPEMSGLELAKAMRGQLLLSMPIIALSAAALKEDRDAALSAGINDYLTKPVDAAELQSKLAKYINKYD